MGSMFGSGFNAKEIGVFVDYLKQIFEMLINLIKSLGKKDDETTTEAPATTTQAAG